MLKLERYFNSEFIEKSQLLNAFQQAVAPILPADCRSHIQAANYQNGELILIVDSPVWAARMRTQFPNISSTISDKLGIEVTKVRIKFQQPTQKKCSPKKAKPHLSRQSASVILTTAETISDEKLKLALQRLAKNAD